jgi:acyl-CoA reductase-like NAD-dependent aldehyde dehydrogenase
MAKFLCNYVNGKWVETGRTFANINPVNGSKVCDVSEADPATVDQAVKGARAAMASEWGSVSTVDRSALLGALQQRAGSSDTAPLAHDALNLTRSKFVHRSKYVGKRGDSRWKR